MARTNFCNIFVSAAAVHCAAGAAELGLVCSCAQGAPSVQAILMSRRYKIDMYIQTHPHIESGDGEGGAEGEREEVSQTQQSGRCLSLRIFANANEFDR